MFILHSSNKTENLVAHLTTVMHTQPLRSPFIKEVFLIQSQGMERWLSQQLASEFGVWANYDFLFPAKFFSGMAKKIDSRLNDEAFDRHKMLWRIEALLRRLEGDAFLPLLQYLDVAGSNNALKRYQLAQQLSQLFDQYQMMRPDLLAQWQKNELAYTDTPSKASEHWQQALWRQITQQTGHQHRGSLWLAAIDKLKNTEAGTFAGKLPERVFVFGLTTMPPLFLNYLIGLSVHCDVHFFLLNPSQEYWLDLPTKRQQIKQKTFEGFEEFVGHPLLVSLGQQGREFLQVLLEEEDASFQPFKFESFEDVENEQPNNLQCLQNDILFNSLTNSLQLALDNSISIHACHSRMREVEVLKNQLLRTLEDDLTVELRDIVVMAPDIQVYEPFIAAVFHDIQHAIADRSLRLSNNTLDAFIRFLDLSQSRFGWQTVLDLLVQAVVYPSFDLSLTDLELIEHWLLDTHVRWGKSAAHKGELGLPELSENTWQATLDRLLMGYAVGDDADFVTGILPYCHIEGSSAQALGGLDAFMQLLFTASRELKQPKILSEWSSTLSVYADKLLGDNDSPERQELNGLLEELSADLADVHHDAVDLAVIISWLNGEVSERKSSNGFLRGQLTFCSMLPMRSIPFKVIALLGMNEGEFPKIDSKPTFDLLAQHFRKGDRSRRADDRYQFLEILLSTRGQLIITYIGQSISHNEKIAPSVIVSELLDVLQNSYALKNCITYQPLQAFSPRYFDGNSDLFSFSAADCQTAKALIAPKPEPRCWWQGTTDAQPERVIELADLLSFFRHPQRYFMRRQLDLRFNGLEDIIEEREPFALDKLTRYSIHHDWLEKMLQGKTLSVEHTQAQGLWLQGALGELEFTRQHVELHRFVERINDKQLGKRLLDTAIDLNIDGYRLIGKLTDCYENGSLLYRYASLKGKDFISALLHHLLMNAIEPHTTFLLSNNAEKEKQYDELILLPAHCGLAQLSSFIDIYQQGQQRPDAFFVEAAFAYVKHAYSLANGSRSAKSALDVAKEQLTRAIEQSYEPELQRLYANVADMGLILADGFEEQCRTLLQPIWDISYSFTQEENAL